MFNKFTYIDIQVWEISISSVYYKIVLLFSRHSLFSRISIVFSSPRIVTSPIDSHSVTPRMLFVQAPNVAHHRKAQNNWTSTIPIEFGASAQTTSADWKQVARDPRIQDPWRSHLYNFFNSGKHLCFKISKRFIQVQAGSLQSYGFFLLSVSIEPTVLCVWLDHFCQVAAMIAPGPRLRWWTLKR